MDATRRRVAHRAGIGFACNPGIVGIAGTAAATTLPSASNYSGTPGTPGTPSTPDRIFLNAILRSFSLKSIKSA